MIRNLISLFSLLFFAIPLFAQPELGLHFLRQNWHSNETNPAIVMDTGGVFRLPGLYNGLFLDGPSYSEMVTKVNGEPVIDVDQVVTRLDPQNFIKDDFEIQTVAFAFPIKNKLLLSFGHSIKYHGFFKYPKELIQVVYQGNAQFIGESVDIGNEIQVTGYHSMDIGLAYKFGKLTLGAKAKFLSGFTDITTDPDHKSISLYTDPDIYQVSLEGDYVLNSANTLDYNSYDDYELDLNFGTFTTDRFFDGSKGWAFDLGLHYETEKWDLAASVLNLGSGITWNTDVSNYTIDGSYDYDGLDFSNAITGGETQELDAVLDSIEQIFQPERTTTEYISNIPQKIYLSAMYKATDKLKIGGGYFYEDFRGTTRSLIGLHGNYDLAKWLNLGLTYSVSNDTYNNLGASLMLQGKGFQLFAVSDNIIDLIDVTNGNTFSIRLGGNIFFLNK